MNISAKSPADERLLLAAALAVTLTGCGVGTGDNAVEPPLAGASIGGDFELTSSDGSRVRWTDFEGRYRMVYFGYAYCPDVCPTDVQRAIQGLNQFADSDPGRAAMVQPIFITIDPERDTPAVVGEFASAFSDDLIGLTGTPEEVRAAADAFRVYYEKGEPTASGGYLMNHSDIVYLFGPDGAPIATLPTDEGADAITAELDRWVS
ncbi:MAG: SCO family protein [Erythrobacter sp.]|jgi:protein SCO1/2|nr:SCO family protein [Erythrobacter sp.]